MINTFWNLCRTCPIPAETKFHAEYKRSFPWQQDLSKNDVVVKPPDASSLEPALSGKKKHPEAAYRANEVLGTDRTSGQREAARLNDTHDRARAEERNNKSKVGSRSRSADPSLGRGRPVMLMVQSNPLEDAVQKHTATEYRAAFAWPPKPSLPPEDGAGCRLADATDGHSSRRQGAAEATIDHLAYTDDTGHEQKKVSKRTEYKAKFKPFSSYMYIDGSWKKPKATVSEATPSVVDPNSWYTEVVERLQKADEYRWRSRASALPGGDQLQHVYSRQGDLWKHVDANTSLAALALAQTPRKPPSVPAKTPPKERPLPTSIYRSSSAKKKEKADAESGPAASEKKKESPTKAVSPMKAEVRGSTPAKPSPPPSKATPPMARQHKQQATPKAAVSGKPRPPSRPLQESAAPPAAKPRAVVRPASAVTAQDGKIWLKPEGKKEDEKGQEEGKLGKGGESEGEKIVSPGSAKQKTEAATEGEAATDEVLQTPAETPCSERKSDAVRPSSLPPMNGSSASSSVLGSSDLASPSPLPEPQAGPVPLTTVKSPEEMTGVKSPDPETWTVPLDTGKGLEWTDGQTAGEWSKMRSPSLGTTPTVDSSSKPATIPEKTEPAIPEGKVDPIPKVPPTDGPVPLDASNMKAAAAAGGDVLDKARNRLEEFWVTGK